MTIHCHSFVEIRKKNDRESPVHKESYLSLIGAVNARCYENVSDGPENENKR